MIAPLKWIRDYVTIDIAPEEFADRMIMIGNGVEGIEKLGDNMKKVVVGRIEKIEKHPDADKLVVCQIDVGEQELQIVTGADNVFEGALVPVALVGAELPNGVKIKKGKLRGVESYGMLCSGEELCIKDSDYPGAEVYGILILKEEYAPGTDMREVLMMNDTVIEFEVGANRPDCLSVLGIAKEAAAALEETVKLPETDFEEHGGDISDYVTVTVEDRDLCPRYMARAVKNVKIGPSPRWMQERLRAAGVRPISNIVDITNYVMIETGQPMHAFDARDIRGGHIVVRRAENGEKMTTLDGKDREYTSSMLMICDEDGPIGIAGIMGGENSEIKEDTTTVVFEAAKFAYGNIRQTARALGMATEASMRFSKGVDCANVEFAMKRACRLVEELAAGENVSGVIDVLSEDLSEKIVDVTADEINALLGTELSADKITDCLGRVSIRTDADKLQEGKISCHVPAGRGDIDGKADIAEEVARIYGYNNIPENPVQGKPMTDVGGLMKHSTVAVEAIKTYINSTGFFECLTYSFVGESDFDKLCLPAEHSLRKAVRIKNPLGDDTSVMRTTLIPSILRVMALNQKRRNKDIKVYEVNRVYLPRQLPLTELPDERLKLCLAVNGKDYDFYTLKEEMENICEVMNIDAEFDVRTGGMGYFHPGRKALMYIGDVLVGQIGEIHPDVADNFGLLERTYVAQMDLEHLLDCMGTKKRFQALPKYPAIERDIAITVAKDAESGTIRNAIRRCGCKYLESAELFDVYEGAQAGLGRKSLAYSLTFRSPDGTLTDDDIKKDMDRIISLLENDFDAALRDA